LALSLFFYDHLTLLELPSFPTRRSSDLRALSPPRTCVLCRSRRRRLRATTTDRPCTFARAPAWAAARARCPRSPAACIRGSQFLDRKSTRLNSSHVAISYAVFCLKKKNK